MTNQSKRDILEEILTRLAILQAKVDYLVSASHNNPELDPFIETEPSEDCVKVDLEFPSVSIKLHETIEDQLGGDIHISGAKTTNLQSKDVYFNGEEWVDRPEDLSYIQKFYKEREVE